VDERDMEAFLAECAAFYEATYANTKPDSPFAMALPKPNRRIMLSTLECIAGPGVFWNMRPLATSSDDGHIYTYTEWADVRPDVLALLQEAGENPHIERVQTEEDDAGDWFNG
jgi:hypothetical protein